MGKFYTLRCRSPTPALLHAVFRHGICICKGMREEEDRLKKPVKLKILPALLSASMCLTPAGVPGTAVTAYAGEAAAFQDVDGSGAGECSGMDGTRIRTGGLDTAGSAAAGAGGWNREYAGQAEADAAAYLKEDTDMDDSMSRLSEAETRETGPEAAAKQEKLSDMETAADAAGDADQETGADTGTGTGTGAGIETGTGTETETETGADAEYTAAAGLDSGMGRESSMEPENSPGADTVAGGMDTAAETGLETGAGTDMETETGAGTDAGEETGSGPDAAADAGEDRNVQKAAGINPEADSMKEASGGSYTELNENRESTGVSIRWYQDQGLAVAVNEEPGTRKIFTRELAAYITAEEIPAVQISGFSEIGTRAFEDAAFLQGISMDGTAEIIGDYAFMGCTGLKSAVMPDSILKIGAYAFYQCSLLELDAFPESLTSLRIGAFWNCTRITPQRLPEGLDEIEGFVFFGCENMELECLPDGITAIGDAAFSDCLLLDLAELPESVVRIGVSAFARCSGLSLAELPEGVEVIGEAAFMGCSRLALKRLPEGVSEIGMSTFSECPELALEYLPEGISSIGLAAFRGCTSMNLRELPQGLREIGRHAFRRCTSLALDRLPESIEVIGGYAFEDCPSLALEYLPEGVTDIGEYAFSACGSLKISQFPDSLKTVGEYAFWKSPGVVVSSPNCADVSPVKAVLTWYTVTCVSGTDSTDFDASDVIGTARYKGYYGDDISDYVGRWNSEHPSVDGYVFAAFAVPDGNEKIILAVDDTETMVYAVYRKDVKGTFTVALPACIEMGSFRMDGSGDGTGIFTGKIDYQVSYRMKDRDTVLSVCLVNAENGGSMDDSFLQYGAGASGSYTGNGGMIRRDADRSVVAWKNANAWSGKYEGSSGVEGNYGSALYDSSTGMYEGNGTIAVTAAFSIRDTGAYSGHATVRICCE